MMWYDNLSFITIAYAVIIWIIVFFLLKLMMTSKRSLGIFLSYLLIVILALVLNILGFPYGLEIFSGITLFGLVITFVLAAPDIRDAFEDIGVVNKRKSVLVMGSEKTKLSIEDAVIELSKTKTGALITLEKNDTLDEYAEKAITLDSDVSKELLVNIFVPNTPLHDGAVIIRGDRVLCAGAYFVLSNNENFNKTSTGSRHRAALGISEVSDSLTIVVSEETGNISLAIEGIMLRINDRDKLNEYLTTFMK